jgi:hypothetical protein
LYRCREDAKYIIAARELVEKIHRERTTPITASFLNVILAGLAERGVATVAMTVFAEDFRKYNVKRNEDTYSLVLESLGKAIRRFRRHPHGNTTLKVFCNDILTDAEYVLSAMENDNIKPTRYLINEYTSLLCQANEIETASEVLFDAAASSSSTVTSFSNNNDVDITNQFSELLVSSKAVYYLATENIKLGRFDVARKLSVIYPFGTINEHGKIVSSIPNLTYNIDRLELQNKRYMQKQLPQEQHQQETTNTGIDTNNEQKVEPA